MKEKGRSEGGALPADEPVRPMTRESSLKSTDAEGALPADPGDYEQIAGSERMTTARERTEQLGLRCSPAAARPSSSSPPPAAHGGD